MNEEKFTGTCSCCQKETLVVRFWFSDGERKWFKLLCDDCIKDLMQSTQDLTGQLEKTLGELRKPWWKKIWEKFFNET